MSVLPPSRLAAAAETLVGVPFRLHGREPESGLDCVGLVGAALRRCGVVPTVPTGYRLRVLDVEPLLRFAEASGLARTLAPVSPGDVMLVSIAGTQPHLLIAASDRGFIHAHAGLRRVVCQPGPCPWPVVLRWRLDEKG